MVVLEAWEGAEEDLALAAHSVGLSGSSLGGLYLAPVAVLPVSSPLEQMLANEMHV